MRSFFLSGTIRGETDPKIFWRADGEESIEIGSIDQVTPKELVKQLSIDPHMKTRAKTGRGARRGKKNEEEHGSQLSKLKTYHSVNRFQVLKAVGAWPTFRSG